MKTFDNVKYKIPQLLRDVTANESSIDFLKLLDVSNSGCNNFENFNVSTLNHVPIIYDLYNFLGITYTNNEAGAIPASCYDFDGTAYRFNLPVYGYRVLQGVDPVVFSGGATPWEFITSVNVIHTRVNYLNLPDSYIKKVKIVSYLYTDNNTSIPSLNILIDPISEIYTDFSYFYRWLKVTDGYVLDFYSFFPYFTTIEVKLKTNAYFLDKDLGNENQSNIF
jgi:hypothetical protein